MGADPQDSRDYVHPDTGEVYVPKEDLENCEGELRKARRKIKAFERGQGKERLNYRERPKVLAAIRYWAKLTGHPKAKESDDRFDMILRRRKDGYLFGDPLEEPPSEPQATICLAIDGLASYPYVTDHGRDKVGKPKERYDRLGIALGSGEDLERFARLGWIARHNGGVAHH